VQTGIDVLRAEKLAPLSNMRIGLITNHSGIDSTGRRTIDRLYNAKGIKLAAIFSRSMACRVKRIIKPHQQQSLRPDCLYTAFTEKICGLQKDA